MSALGFSIVGATAVPYAASPTLALRLHVTETTGVRLHAIALRGQLQIEPQKRRYGAAESERLDDLFGTVDRYGETLRPLLWTHVSTTILAFEGETEVDLAIPCSYDFDVAAHKYLAALEGGEIPIVLYFSGTVLLEGERGVSAELVSWTSEAKYRLPVTVWRETMDAHFPNTAWLRVSTDVFVALDRVRRARGSRSWDATLGALCDEARTPRDRARALP
ncbi:MAG: DUF6084 family protein [Vulcanimicrobiaceae bacterium]